MSKDDEINDTLRKINDRLLEMQEKINILSDKKLNKKELEHQLFFGLVFSSVLLLITYPSISELTADNFLSKSVSSLIFSDRVCFLLSHL